MIRTLIAAALLVSATASQAIDLVLQATTQAQILTALKARGLAQDVTDLQGATTTVPINGVDTFVWWAGSGKLMTAKAVPDPQNPMGPPLTPATFLAGFVMLVRIYDPADALANPVDGEQYSRSQIARFIKNNGTPGTFSLNGCTINYYQISNVKMTRFADLSACLTAQGLPGHEWAGGNNP